MSLRNKYEFNITASPHAVAEASLRFTCPYKSIFFIFSLCLLLLIFSPVSAQNNSIESSVSFDNIAFSSAPKKIAIFIPNQTVFWHRVESLAKKSAEDLGVEISVFAYDLSGEKMMQGVRQAIAEGAQGIIIPGFHEAEMEVMALVEKHQIPLIVIINGIKDDSISPRGRYKQWIGSVLPDDISAGKTLIRQLVERAENKKQKSHDVLAIAGFTFTESSERRVLGLKEFARTHPEIHSVTVVHGDWSAEKARKVFLEAYAENPNISIVWCAGDAMARGVADAIAELDLDNPPLIGGIDWDIETATYLENGKIAVSVGGHFMDGAWGVVLMYDYLSGRDFSSQALVFNSVMVSAYKEDMQRYRSFFTDKLKSIDFSFQSLVKNPDKPIYDFSLIGILVETKEILDLNLTLQEKNWLDLHGNILLGGNFSSPPFSFISENGNFSGMSFGFTNLISKRLGIEFTPVREVSWNNTLEDIAARKLDMIPALTKSDAQSEFMNFTKPFVTFPTVISTRNDTRKIQSLWDLVGERVAVTNEFVTEEIELKHPDIVFVRYESISAAITALNQREVIALVDNLALLSYEIHADHHHTVSVVAATEYESEFSIAVRKDWPELVGILNKAIDTISPQEREAIKNNWMRINVEMGVHYKTILLYVIPIVAAVLLVFGFILFSYRRLKRQEAQLQKAHNSANTARLSLMDQLAFQQALIDSIPMPLFYKDENARFKGFNKAYEEAFSVKGEDLKGLTVMDLDYLPERDRELYQAEDIDVIKFQKDVKREIKMQFSDGEMHDTLYWVSGFKDSNGKPAGLVGHFVDISEEKENAKRLAAALFEADKANKAKGDFLANMSHEIRTPMNAIIGMSELALKTELNKKQRNYINKVNISAESLMGIINDILDFSKIEAGKLKIEKIPFQLGGVFDHLASILGLKSEEKALELLFDIHADVPVSLLGDPLRLGQVLVNLGGNAVKFTKEGEVIVGVKVQERMDDDVVLLFSVKDTGIGMSLEQQNGLFQPFSQADASTSRRFGGTGLGLTISKKLTELMNGEIWFESSSGVGSCFQFTVPLGVGPEMWDDPIVERKLLDSMRVLLVDDNSSAREIMSRMLDSLHIAHEVVSNGGSAIQLVTEAQKGQSPFNLIFMDWQMPEMNGIDCAKIIIDKLGSHAPKVILVTAYGLEEAAVEASNVGFSSILTKPVTASTLLDAIHQSQGAAVEMLTRAKQEDKFISNASLKLAGAKILLVEDNEINQELATELLQIHGMQVTVVSNGQLAIDALAQADFDCILMDCQMPVMDGYTATREIRKQEKYKNLPILAMTANAMAGDKEKVLAAGMNDHIAKPINVEVMLSTMAQWVSLNPMGNQLSFLNKLAGVDTTVGLSLMGGSESFYRKILIKFRNSQTTFIQQFEASLQGDDATAPERLAHTLKGLAANVGASALEIAASALEAACQENTQSQEVIVLLQKLELQLFPVIDGLAVLGDLEA